MKTRKDETAIALMLYLVYSLMFPVGIRFNYVIWGNYTKRNFDIRPQVYMFPFSTALQDFVIKTASQEIGTVR